MTAGPLSDCRIRMTGYGLPNSILVLDGRSGAHVALANNGKAVIGINCSAANQIVNGAKCVLCQASY